jgi:hypothetical protein
LIFSAVAFLVADDIIEASLVFSIKAHVRQERTRSCEMNWKKLNWILLVSSVIVLGAFSGSPASDTVEWNVYRTLQLDATPIDLVISPDARRIFVLTDQGKILVYSSTTNLEATLNVGKNVDQIKLGPGEDTLILKSSKDKTVQLVTLDFIQNINVSGAPFKGPEDAAVVIAVFDDFQ